ncbi:MAG: hypothetical protein CJBNEKGG_01489 [Prosthecobacter sp.]|nr:hypothetical protein [Prosthecobacter sp.]
MMNRKFSFLSWRVWAVYAVLFAVSIPWYWPQEVGPLLLGMPLWAAVSVLGSALISAYTAWLLVKHWPDEEDDQA